MRGNPVAYEDPHQSVNISLDDVGVKRQEEHRLVRPLDSKTSRKYTYQTVTHMRKYLGLRNSSNLGEKSNDLLVSARQKHNGMSWSKMGSAALAAITALVYNKEYLTWFRTGELNFRLVPREVK